jgi:hypothetical protein
VTKISDDSFFSVPRDLEADKKFITDFSTMKADSTFADGVLVCQDKEIEVHRVVLAARSEHFRNMFANTAFVEGKMV